MQYHSASPGALFPELHVGSRYHFNDVAKNNTNLREASAFARVFSRNGSLKLFCSFTLSTNTFIIVILYIWAVTRYRTELCDLRFSH